MNKKILVLFTMILLVVLVVGCSKQPPVVDSSSGNVEQEKTVAEVSDSVEQDMVDINKLSQDLSTDELNDLDKELADVENADI